MFGFRILKCVLLCFIVCLKNNYPLSYDGDIMNISIEIKLDFLLKKKKRIIRYEETKNVLVSNTTKSTEILRET